MLISCAMWFVLLLVFAHMPHFAAGIPVLALAGSMQSMSMIPMTVLLLRNSDGNFAAASWAYACWPSMATFRAF